MSDKERNISIIFTVLTPFTRNQLILIDDDDDGCRCVLCAVGKGERFTLHKMSQLLKICGMKDIFMCKKINGVDYEYHFR